VNGSRLDNAPLTHERPVALTGKAVVSLYRNYEIEIVPLLGAYDRGCEISNEKIGREETRRRSRSMAPSFSQPLHNQPLCGNPRGSSAGSIFAVTAR
jgi:hypothetical protein